MYPWRATVLDQVTGRIYAEYRESQKVTREEWEKAFSEGRAFRDTNPEARYIEDGERLNCPACGGSGHVDDVATPAEVTAEEVINAFHDELHDVFVDCNGEITESAIRNALERSIRKACKFPVADFEIEGGLLTQEQRNTLVRDAKAALTAQCQVRKDGQGVSDEQIIAICNAAGVRWIPPSVYEDDDDFPGMFDMTRIAEMMSLFATIASPISEVTDIVKALTEGYNDMSDAKFFDALERLKYLPSPSAGAVVPEAMTETSRVPDDFRNQAAGYRAGWNDFRGCMLTAAPEVKS
jgi:hypothetical protein